MDDTSISPNNAHVAAIAAAYLGNPSNTTDKGDLGDIIRQITTALKAADSLASSSNPEATPEPEFQKPSAAAIRKTITPAHLISLIDGRPYKSLKRHLASKGHTPASYRERYGLKPDYPMTAPDYSAQRSELARKLGLGQLRAQKKAQALAEAVQTAPSVVAPVKAPKKAKAPSASETSAPVAEPHSPPQEAAVSPAAPATKPARKPKSAPVAKTGKVIKPAPKPRSAKADKAAQAVDAAPVAPSVEAAPSVKTVRAKTKTAKPKPTAEA